MLQNNCGPDEYFDGLDNSCVPCRVICHPNVTSHDFCHNNCPGYMNPGTLTKGTDESYTTPKRKPSPLWVYVTSSSTAATKVLSSATSSSGSAAAGLGEASLVSILHSLFVIVLVLIIIFGVAVVVVCVVRRHYDHSGTISASSLAPKLPAADNQRSYVGCEECTGLMVSMAGNDQLAADKAASRDAATSTQVHLARDTLIYSMSLQPLTDYASSLPVTMPPTA